MNVNNKTGKIIQVDINDGTDTDTIYFSGYLRQKITTSIFRDKYKKYYFELYPKKLRKYNESYNIVEEIEHTKYNIIDGSFITSKKNTILMIDLLDNNNKIILICDKDTDFDEWMKVLTSRTNDITNEKEIATLESILEPCVIADNFGIILGFNNGAQTLFGYTKSEVLGSNVSILMPDSYAKVHDHYLEKYRQTDEINLIGKPRSLPIKTKNNSIINSTLSLGRYRQKIERNY